MIKDLSLNIEKHFFFELKKLTSTSSFSASLWWYGDMRVICWLIEWTEFISYGDEALAVRRGFWCYLQHRNKNKLLLNIYLWTQLINFKTQWIGKINSVKYKLFSRKLCTIKWYLSIPVAHVTYLRLGKHWQRTLPFEWLRKSCKKI